MAVGVVIHCSKFALSLGIEVGDGSLVDLSAVLELRAANLERTRVEVLINICAIQPVVAYRAVHVEGELLLSEVVGLVIECAVESLFAKFGPGVYGITNVAGGDGGF